MLFGKDRQRNIMAHGSSCFNAVFRHGKDLPLHILIGVAEDSVKLVTKLLLVCRDLLVRDLQFRKPEEI